MIHPSLDRIFLNKINKDLSNAVRFLSIDAVQKANSGHPGMPMGMADVATVLFRNFLKYNPKNPSWLNRDRFVLSAGHGSMLLYSLLYLTGYKSISLNDIKIIFSTDAKTWNQNLVFLDKKLSMKKLQLENNSNYSLKTTFSNGYVVITPYFNGSFIPRNTKFRILICLFH